MAYSCGFKWKIHLISCLLHEDGPKSKSSAWSSGPLEDGHIQSTRSWRGIALWIIYICNTEHMSRFPSLSRLPSFLPVKRFHTAYVPGKEEVWWEEEHFSLLPYFLCLSLVIFLKGEKRVLIEEMQMRNLRIFPIGINGIGIWVFRVHTSAAIVPCFCLNAVLLFLSIISYMVCFPLN